MTLPTRRAWRLFLLVALSISDVALTCWLVGRPGGNVYEANPVAAWALGRWGWAGLAGIKVASVGLALAALAGVAAYRPRTAAWAVRFACVVLAGVVAYSSVLAATADREPTARAKAEADAAGRRLDAAVRPRRAAARFSEGMYRDLRAGRPLPAAAREVVEADPRLTRWCVPPGVDRAAPDAERVVAAGLVDAVAAGAAPRDAALVRRLRAEYRARYGEDDPGPAVGVGDCASNPQTAAASRRNAAAWVP